MGSRLGKKHRKFKCGCISRDSYHRKTNLKFSLFGPCEVWKTALQNRIVNDSFIEEYSKTITKNCLEIKRTVDGEEITINIVDMSGEEKFRSVNKLFYIHSDALLMVFALDDKNSFEELKQRYNYTSNINNEYWSKAYLIGNKKDKCQPEVSEKEARKFANEINGKFFIVSCLTNEGIEEMIDIIVKEFE